MSFEKKYNLRDMILQRIPPQTIYESEQCWIPMFHGTSSSVVNLPPHCSVRKNFCKQMPYRLHISALAEIRSRKIPPAKQQEIFGTLAPLVVDAFVCAGSMKASSTWFNTIPFTPLLILIMPSDTLNGHLSVESWDTLPITYTWGCYVAI